MGIFDEFTTSLKKSQNDLKEADVNRQLKELEKEPGKAGSELSSGSVKSRGTTAQPGAPPKHVEQQTADSACNPHKGYSKLVAWIKTTYGSRIKAALLDPYQQKLLLEQISNDSCCKLSEKTKKGFLAYLKYQNYEELIKK